MSLNKSYILLLQWIIHYYWPIYSSNYFLFKGFKDNFNLFGFIQVSIVQHLIQLIMLYIILLLCYSKHHITLWHLIMKHRVHWLPNSPLRFYTVIIISGQCRPKIFKFLHCFRYNSLCIEVWFLAFECFLIFVLSWIISSPTDPPLTAESFCTSSIAGNALPRMSMLPACPINY